MTDAAVLEVIDEGMLMTSEQVIDKTKVCDVLLDIRLAGGNVVLIDGVLADVPGKGLVKGEWLAEQLTRLREAHQN
jgi:hypothetical protein